MGGQRGAPVTHGVFAAQTERRRSVCGRLRFGGTGLWDLTSFTAMESQRLLTRARFERVTMTRGAVVGSWSSRLTAVAGAQRLRSSAE